MNASPRSNKGDSFVVVGAAVGVDASLPLPAAMETGETSKLTIRNAGPIGLRLQERPSGHGVCVANIDPKSHPAIHGCDDGVEVKAGMHVIGINEHDISMYAFDTAMAVLRRVAQQRPCTLILRHQSAPCATLEVLQQGAVPAGGPAAVRAIVPDAQPNGATIATLPSATGSRTPSTIRLPRETLRQQVRDKRTEMGVVASDAWVDEALKRASTVHAAVIWLMENSEPHTKVQPASHTEGCALRASV
eukprot:g1254.t1